MLGKTAEEADILKFTKGKIKLNNNIKYPVKFKKYLRAAFDMIFIEYSHYGER